MATRNLLASVLGVAMALGGCASSATPPEHVSPAKHPPTTQPLTAPLTKPALPPLSQPSYTLSPETMETLPAEAHYAHISVKTTFHTMQKEIETALKELEDASTGGKLVTTGPAVFVYLGATGQLDDVFTLEIGFAAAAETQPVGRIKVRELPALRCVTMTFTGNLQSIDKAYDKLVPQAMTKQWAMTGESREIYRRWGGVQSDNNQVQLAIGIKPAE